MLLALASPHDVRVAEFIALIVWIVAGSVWAGTMLRGWRS